MIFLERSISKTPPVVTQPGELQWEMKWSGWLADVFRRKNVPHGCSECNCRSLKSRKAIHMTHKAGQINNNNQTHGIFLEFQMKEGGCKLCVDLMLVKQRIVFALQVSRDPPDILPLFWCGTMFVMFKSYYISDSCQSSHRKVIYPPSALHFPLALLLEPPRTSLFLKTCQLINK